MPIISCLTRCLSFVFRTACTATSSLRFGSRQRPREALVRFGSRMICSSRKFSSRSDPAAHVWMYLSLSFISTILTPSLALCFNIFKSDSHYRWTSFVSLAFAAMIRLPGLVTSNWQTKELGSPLLRCAYYSTPKPRGHSCMQSCMYQPKQCGNVLARQMFRRLPWSSCECKWGTNEIHSRTHQTRTDLIFQCSLILFLKDILFICCSSEVHTVKLQNWNKKTNKLSMNPWYGIVNC